MTRLDWRPAAAVALIAAVALAVPALPLPDPLRMDVAHSLAPPGALHPLGQDEYGRDVLSRLLWGARVSLLVAAASSGLAAVLGVALGVLGGFLGGAVEAVAVRSMDVVLCFPPLLLALLVVTLAGPGAATLVPVLALVYLPGFVRVAHAGVRAMRSLDYVDAVRALGAGRGRIMLRTVLPNIGGPVLVQISLAAASAIVLESGLSFLGLGVVPPAPSWGLMIGAARATMPQAPLLLLWPCLALSLTILAMNALCDALRDAVDPHRPPRRVPRAALAPPGPPPEGEAVLRVQDLTVEIDTPSGRVRPVRGVSLVVQAGETLAVVGESGSGKSLTGLAVMGLLPPAARVAAGAAWLEGQEVLSMPAPALRRLRGARMAMVFQDALSSLNPMHRIGAQVAEGLRAHGGMERGAARVRAGALLARVGIPDPVRRAQAFPHELSGGMRQRVMAAIGIALDPVLLIADEPTTALDVTIQAQVLALLGSLKRERGMAMVFISHSLPVVAEVADRIAVMYAGEVVEAGDAAAVLGRPLHPYTAALLRSAPGEDGSLPVGIPGAMPPPHLLPPGCVFAPRCAHRRPACVAAHPALADVLPGRSTRCIRWSEVAGA